MKTVLHEELPTSLGMFNQEIIQERKETLGAIAEKSLLDPEFRKELISDPRGTIDRHYPSLGQSIEGKVIVLEDNFETFHLILPASGSERQLDIGNASDIVARASKDSSYRTALLCDPNGVVREHMDAIGSSLPSFVEVKVTEFSDKDSIIFIPAEIPLRGEAAVEATRRSLNSDLLLAGYSMYCDTTSECQTTATTPCDTMNPNCTTYTYVPRCPVYSQYRC